jgi:putative Holliday junction resolvase
MGRWLAIDLGAQRTGLAIGDTADGIATPLEVLDGKSIDEIIDRVRTVIDDYTITGLVMGWPLNMDDTEGPQGKLSRQVAFQLAQVLGIDVRMWDERLSSFSADQALAGQLTRKKRKGRQDAIAAATFLQDFLTAGADAVAQKPEDLGPWDEDVK